MNESFGQNLPQYLNNLYSWSIGIAGLLAILMLIYAGYLYVSSAGNTEQINQAKDFVISALAGLVLLILASLILKSLGVSL